MSNETTIWQDRFSELRGHKLMTKQLAETIPTLDYSDGENKPPFEEQMAYVKFFSPYNGWRWYVLEWEPSTGRCLGYVQGFFDEFGYFDLNELAEATGTAGAPAVERDLYWKPCTIGEIQADELALVSES